MADLQIGTPITLNCGLTLPNRLVKAAMSEHMTENFMPNETIQGLYKHFADGGWGMVITG